MKNLWSNRLDSTVLLRHWVELYLHWRNFQYAIQCDRKLIFKVREVNNNYARSIDRNLIEGLISDKIYRDLGGTE